MKISKWYIGIEFAWYDLWIGMYIHTGEEFFDAWICLLPTLAIHIVKQRGE